MLDAELTSNQKHEPVSDGFLILLQREYYENYERISEQADDDKQQHEGGKQILRSFRAAPFLQHVLVVTVVHLINCDVVKYSRRKRKCYDSIERFIRNRLTKSFD